MKMEVFCVLWLIAVCRANQNLPDYSTLFVGTCHFDGSIDAVPLCPPLRRKPRSRTGDLLLHVPSDLSLQNSEHEDFGKVVLLFFIPFVLIRVSLVYSLC